MLYKTLTPVEKKRLHKSISVVINLVNKKHLSEVGVYIVRERLKIIIRLLGGDVYSAVSREQCTRILKDRWPFKLRRLRNIINGRHNRQ